MRRTIEDIYKSGFLYLSIWLLTGLLGCIQMNNSGHFDKWFEYHVQKEVLKKGYETNVFDALAYAPPFFFFIELIAAIIGHIFFEVFYLILEKTLSKRLKLFITFFPISLCAFIGYFAYVDLAENIKWGFSILALQDVVLFVYFIFLGRKYWILIQG